ncbi:ABC transporter substrate-binding protein [Peribacillus huizhouensis]|uniref:Multiple sugar transport system substrate-binding protein n=1 Tax=Peribacillus huizhouensis TaxID=1501239 RepID=A0ABR6CU63_9BACI|nr:sugar ABC transporter substrate-binding protein [Peribacillus huizhouensis]MBA9028140.1 multiple sugar transport system substrate-binding protein [Peribacillus huizhouensis]
MKLSKMKLILLFTIALALLLSACNSTKSNSDEATEDGKVKIRFATWDVGNDVQLQQNLIDEFNAKNEKIKVVLEAYGGEYDTKITAGIGAKDAPDVMYMWNYPQYKDALEPLDSYIDKNGEEYKSDFYESLWNYNSVGGETLGLPVGYTTHVVYYNKDLFDEKGLEYPQAGWTWADLQETAKKLTNKDKKITGFAFPGKPDPYDFEMYLWGNGASYVDSDGKLKGNLNSTKSIETFSLFQDMLKDGYAITTEGSGDTEMKSGKVGMFINGAWYLSPLKEAGINYGVVEVPTFENGKSVSIVSSSGIAMSKDSKHKEAAFEFMKFWTGKEANKERIAFELPVLKSVVEEEKLQEDPVKGVFYSMLEQSEGYTPASFITENWSQVSENLGFVFEQIFNPSTRVDPKKALNEAVK